MLFSSPDYPLYLNAVFFLYALARWGDDRFAPARMALMVLLADVVFLLVAKDPDTLWDPIGGALLRLVASSSDERYGAWPAAMFLKWAAGTAVLTLALIAGARGGRWIASREGQGVSGRAFVIALAAVGVLVLVGDHDGTLDEITRAIVGTGHLLVLAILGVGLGASRDVTTRPLGRMVILFVASSLFYQAWSAAMPGPYRYLLALLFATIALDYYLGLWIESAEDPWKRKALVVVSLCSNLGVLVFFKYADFFTQDVLAPTTGIEVERLNLILPAGISFHTFQSLSYTIDVYRKEIRATRSVIDFATFVLFFPQLVAGPIVRAKDLLPQLDHLPSLELDRATRGLFRILVGLFKKIAIADTLALAIVDRVFEAPERFSSLEVLVGVYAYALQIYLDFSAYSDIAIGSAAVLGFTLPENFRTPYRSSNLQEFWRRWHISLSTWLRDYLYITLGGSRGAEWRTYVNLSLTMLLGGLWHGASWAFIVWGALHGFGLAVTRYFQRATSGDARRAWMMLTACAGIAAGGAIAHGLALGSASTWWQLVAAWLYVTPLWAVATAWLGREQPAVPQPVNRPVPLFELWGRTPSIWAPEVLRLLMCGSAVSVFVALETEPSSTWIPLVVLTWALGITADLVEKGPDHALARLLLFVRRVGAVVLVFHYVCLAWVFFRATSFDNALAVLRQIAALELDHANLVPMVTVSVTAGFVSHFFPDGSFRWLRDRFVALPAYGQGAVLAGALFTLRELAHTKIVPFIYFQF